jgi:hypothetical protein
MFGWLQPFVTRLYIDEGLLKEIENFFSTTPQMLKGRGREATRLYGEGVGEVARFIAGRLNISVQDAIEGRGLKSGNAFIVSKDCEGNLKKIRPFLKSEIKETWQTAWKKGGGCLVYYYLYRLRDIEEWLRKDRRIRSGSQGDLVDYARRVSDCAERMAAYARRLFEIGAGTTDPSEVWPPNNDSRSRQTLARPPRRFGVWCVFDDNGRRRESWYKDKPGVIAVYATRDDAEVTATALRFTVGLAGSDTAACFTYSVCEIPETEATGGPPSPLSENQIAGGATNAGKIRRALEAEGVRLSDDPDKSQFCIKASSAVVRLIANALDVSLWHLTGREQVAFGVLGFLVSDVISQMIDTSLHKGEDKIMFEAVSTCTALDFSGLESSDADFAKQAGDHINKVSDEYNRLVASDGRPLKELGDSIRGWIDDPIHPRLDTIAQISNGALLMAENRVRQRSYSSRGEP